ncbi:MAG: RtcB family protein [Thermoflexales bacterium]|nr:RtcB family protein [Thermoflexales bacterium]
MVSKQDFTQISEYVWEVPASFREGMRVPARVYADEELLETAMRDNSMQQLINTTTLPGVVKYSLVMPDCHQGYGFPIGGVAATRLPHGIISPGGVGYDINCGVRLMGTHLEGEEIRPHLDSLVTALYHNCPSGVGEKGGLTLSASELDEVCVKGSRWALSKGYARPEDLPRTEEHGCLAGADPSHISQRARKRGMPQVGSLGAGNHFIEVDQVVEIYDERAAQAMDLFVGQAVVQLHCGSRGLGHQVCEDYVSELQSAVRRYEIALPDRELVCAPFDSPEGQRYFAAMACAANYAFANRQVLLHHIRRSFEQVLASKVRDFDVFQIYDITHNIAKIETHVVDGQQVKLCVHRKGATRAFGPGFQELPPEYRPIGQPVLVPGSMGTASWVLVGTQAAMEQTFGSSCHGAGRLMSRAQAKKHIRGDDLKSKLEHQGIAVRAGSLAGLAEEAPQAYKDVDAVVEVMHNAGIALKVARLEPMLVIKG